MLAPGMFLLGLGIALVTKAGLGTSPISSIPYSMSLILPRFTMGNYTIAMSILLVLAQIIMLWGKPGEIMGRGSGKAVSWVEIGVQFLLSVALGYLIDLSMFLIRWLELDSYWQHMLGVVVGCFIMAFGIYIQLMANVAMAPGDAFIRALAAVTGRPYHQMKVVTDCSIVAVAMILCLVFLHRLSGVREGTVICALLVGNLVKMYRKMFTREKHADERAGI